METNYAMGWIVSWSPSALATLATVKKEGLPSLDNAGNRLKSLKGDRKGQYSIRINDQWRVCFRWKNGDAWSVEITDYH